MALDIYDTTLRDGTQQEGISLTVNDQLRVAGLLDDLGVDYIEGGWPGANRKDTEFFKRAASELNLKNAKLSAFGSTRRPNGDVETDPLLRSLLEAETARRAAAVDREAAAAARARRAAERVPQGCCRHSPKH
jgi:2-isopropylmalate synthase